VFERRNRLARSQRHDLALQCIASGVEAAHPERVVRERVAVDGDTLRVARGTNAAGAHEVDLSAVDRLLVVGGGNAAGTAARALEGVLGERLDDGVVVTDDPAPCDRVWVRAGNHPVPTARNVEGTREVLELTRPAGADDLVLAVVTGGGSALLAAPVDGISLADLRATTGGLLASGAAIGEVNAVRKHLSAVKGGGLARAAAPAPAVGLVFSDVVGNDLGTVASGPTAPDPTTYTDALGVLDRYGVSVPGAVREHLEAGKRGERPETPDDPAALGDVTNRVLADNLTALEAAADVAAEQGYTPLVLSTRIRGEAREAARSHVAVAEECATSGNPVEPPAVLLAGGEVTVAGADTGANRSGGAGGPARGGPNAEFGVSAALELAGRDPATGIVAASVDTDGVDGSSEAAGALADGDTVEEPVAAREALANHATAPYLADRDAAVVTGPTGTNVNDLRVFVVGAGRQPDSNNH
jgi:hydroxypyruvate reductase